MCSERWSKGSEAAVAKRSFKERPESMSPSRGRGGSAKRHSFVKFFKISLHFAARGGGQRQRGEKMTYGCFLDAPSFHSHSCKLGIV